MADQTADIAIIGGGIIGLSCAYELARQSDARIVENFYHALGMNGHGMTCHAGIALATAELVLRGGTTLDLKPMTSKDEVLDFARLDVGRFDRGELLNFEL